MKMIFGLTKTSFVDYPGEVSFVIFLGGCNMRCPYCHNKTIVNKENSIYEIDTVLEMLKERKNFLKAVVITGGEPTIYGEKLIELITKIKKLGFKVKIDTNGSFPNVIQKLILNNLVDYIAMDIKNTFSKYETTTNTKVNIEKIKESIKIIESSGIDYEFRTTINKNMHTKSDIKEIFSYIKDPQKLKLQAYRYSKEQLEDIEYDTYNEEEINKLLKQNQTELI